MPKRKIKLLLTNYQSPGDILMLTAAVRDLHKNHPEKYLTDIDTTAMQIWENNPYITKLKWTKENGKITPKEKIQIIQCQYPLIHQSNTTPYHFIHGFTQHLEDTLKTRIKPTEFKADIHLTNQEKTWTSQIEEQGIKEKFWIIVAGGKKDYTCKYWSPQRYQHIINYFQGKITFVQIGESHTPLNNPNNHYHPPLQGTINLIGKTNIRQLIRLTYHSIGVLCPVTMMMHLAAAVEMKHTPPKNRPCVVIAGGREPPQWEAYPHHQYIHKNGALTCCDNGGCWKSRCQPINDNDPKNHQNTCQNYTQLTPQLRIPRCMDLIQTGEVIKRIETYYEGGALQYNQT